MGWFRKIKTQQLNFFKGKITLPDIVYIDYDGTISDNNGYLYDAFVYSAKKHLTKQQVKEVSKIKEDGDRWAYLGTLKLSQEEEQAFSADFANYMTQQQLKLIKGIISFIKLLNKVDIPVYILSQKGGDSLRNELKKNKMYRYFKGAYGSYDFEGCMKPSPEFTAKIKEATLAKPDKICWMIGNTYTDVEMGKNIGCQSFLVTKEDFKKVNKENRGIVGKYVFFTSYRQLSKLIKVMLDHKKKKLAQIAQQMQDKQQNNNIKK